MNPFDIAIVGGGAAGFFAAVTAAENNPSARIVLFEKSSRVLGKVKISGGGRCNVTHACFDPDALTIHYPRGGRELRGAFHRWQPSDTIDWFSGRGVELKTEADGRVFPVTNDSHTIINCLVDSARAAGVVIRTSAGIHRITRTDPGFELDMGDGDHIRAQRVFVAPGSLKNSPLVASLQDLGHTIEPLVPSLFSLHVNDERIQGLQGISVEPAAVAVRPGRKMQAGPILITHNGFSGPAILRLSAWEARRLYELNYRCDIGVSWIGDRKAESVRKDFNGLRRSHGGKAIKNLPAAGIPARLWERLLQAAGIPPAQRWSHLGRDRENALLNQLLEARFAVNGKTMNKEEFVTCGGIRLSEVDFRTMESRLVPGLHFGGECLDLDGITGGFNFQAAWTTGRLAGLALCPTG